MASFYNRTLISMLNKKSKHDSMKNFLLFLVICFSAAIYAQDLANRVPNEAPFALCFNGKNLNDKVTVKTIQEYPWMQELLEKRLKFSSKDLSQTGIDLTNKQYQYYINKDSVLNYVILMPLNNVLQFEKLIQSKYGDSLKVKRQGAYSSASTSKNHHLAWNDKFVVMINATYVKPYNSYTEPYSDLESMDTTGVLTDSIAVVDTVEPENIPEKTTVILDSKTNTKDGNAKSKKGTKTKIVTQEPADAKLTKEEIHEAQEKANAELEEINRKLNELELKKTDSIECLKIKPTVDLIFKEAFESKTGVETASIFRNNDSKSDFYVFADFDALTAEVYSGLGVANSVLKSIYKKGILNSNFYMNGYFEKDRIRLNNVIVPKDEETKKSYQEIFNSKIDKNLLNYVGDNVLGYYSIAMDTQAIMNYEYKIIKSTLNAAYRSFAKDTSGNEVDVLIDGIALLLDEKAIADLIPGNALFVLHDLKKVKREYVKINYNENYEQTETKATKDEIQPDFTFLMNTRNESFANKLLQLPLKKSKFIAMDYQQTNGYYTLHFEKDNFLENLYIGLKNGVVMFTTSKVNVENLIQQTVMPMQADFKKSITKNNGAAWFDIQKILAISKSELGDYSKSNYYDTLLKNAGEITVESKFKNGAIVSDASYTIKGEHPNSLQYFFDVINEFYSENKEKKNVTE
jgi:hypothetical protein